MNNVTEPQEAEVEAGLEEEAARSYPEDARVLNDWGTVSHPLGARTYMFNTAEGRLTAFHQAIANRLRDSAKA